MIYDKHHPECYSLLRRQCRIVISGSRNYNDYHQFKETLQAYIQKLGIDSKDLVYIAGGAPSGADAHIERYCAENPDEHLIVYPADWDKFKKAAGFIRNIEMIDIATHLLAWWDIKSPGTRHAIDTAKDKSLRVKIHLIKVE